ncbi:hypothetical protein [Hungatella effluvii]|uniref:hypothetical protein n=1 Tax=Hungatella effluvii TaxID=1096246 RepID=UPI0022DEB1A1|nr:hypothetical protein [Hungatella effluvii]
MSLIDIYVRDKQTGEIHKVGEDKHDSIWVDLDGTAAQQTAIMTTARDMNLSPTNAGSRLK